MEIDIVTIFPRFFKEPFEDSLLKRAQGKGLLKLRVHNLRDYTHDRHKTVDDKPFGGGPGMVMKPDPIFECVEEAAKTGAKPWVVLMDARGERFTQALAAKLSKKKRLILICGHYEGIDHRVEEHLTDQSISIGEFVTMGGEAPALCVVEAVTRLIPGVLGNSESLKEESHLEGLEYPQYTRPRDFRGLSVPEVLVSGNHRQVEKWRREKASEMTRKRQTSAKRD